MAMPGLVSTSRLPRTSKDQRRIVDFFQARRVGRVVHGEHGRRLRRRRAQFLLAPVPPTFPWPAIARKRPECRCSRVRSTRRGRRLPAIRNVRPVCGPWLGPGRASAKWPATPADAWRRGIRRLVDTDKVLRADCNCTARRSSCQGHPSQWFVKIVERYQLRMRRLRFPPFPT